MNAPTEAEARNMWCPFGPTPHRPASESHCVASACMAWRWVPQASMDNPSGVPGFGQQRIKREIGFCGLAGAPS